MTFLANGHEDTSLKSLKKTKDTFCTIVNAYPVSLNLFAYIIKLCMQTSPQSLNVRCSSVYTD